MPRRPSSWCLSGSALLLTAGSWASPVCLCFVFANSVWVCVLTLPWHSCHSPGTWELLCSPATGLFLGAERQLPVSLSAPTGRPSAHWEMWCEAQEMSGRSFSPALLWIIIEAWAQTGVWVSVMWRVMWLWSASSELHGRCYLLLSAATSSVGSSAVSDTESCWTGDFWAANR